MRTLSLALLAAHVLTTVAALPFYSADGIAARAVHPVQDAPPWRRTDVESDMRRHRDTPPWKRTGPGNGGGPVQDAPPWKRMGTGSGVGPVQDAPPWKRDTGVPVPV
ncbi:hypothetical protein B0H10DRAFT_2196000 [Mycena sp. CBHHK59/15]|nr:hypothetical protein B0H10DRAFT_2196000 [Mycena sp. CBHHK59/15]